jgi:ribonuclease Z
VRHGDVALQFDAGRATTLRLVEAGCALHELDALFVTHVHSDHVVGLPDLVMTRWVQSTLNPVEPLPIVAVEGMATSFCVRMLEPFADDIAVRMEHVQPAPPKLNILPFALPSEPTVVWESPDADVIVDAIAVHHEPVREAVAYRVRAGDNVVVISGDTRVCDEVRELARGADVLVHEACRLQAMRELITGTPFEHIFEYHADTVALGGLAAAARVEHLLLTHLIPPPTSDEQSEAFATDVRRGGYDGRLTVGTDLTTIELE